jgi:tetratricopeptide (TPR) repeat protein
MTNPTKYLVMKTEIKALVAEGKLDEALEKLVAFLESQNDQFSALDRAAKVTQSEYNQSKERELQGLLTEDQIRLTSNKTVNKILEILEFLDKGASPTPSSVRKKWLLYGAIGAGLMLAIVLVLRGISPKTPAQEPVDPVKPVDTSQVVVGKLPIDCPSFAPEAKYTIVVFDFTTRTGIPDNSDQFLVSQLDFIFDRNGFKADAALIEGYKGLIDASFSKSLVENCTANMVIWGSVFSETAVEINFYAPNIDRKEREVLDSLLEFREQGNFQTNIKQAALIIASRVLVMNNNPGAVAESENAYREVAKDKTIIASNNPKVRNAETIATMTLANAHVSAKQYKKSIPYYDKLLVKNHRDTVALNNSFIAHVKLEDLVGAEKASDSLERYKKNLDPALIEAANLDLERKGFTFKSPRFKQKTVEQQLPQKNLPKE